jgi:hypothetical protein
MLTDSITILTSYMTSQIMTVIFPPTTRCFFASLSRLIASLVVAGVIGGGILVGNIAR